MLRAQAVENRGNLLSQFLGRNPDDLEPGPGGISKGAENVEHGTNSDFASWGSGVFHRRVKVGSEHKADAYCLQTLSDSFSAELNPPSQCFQDIGAAAVAGHCPGAVLGYFESCAGRNKCGGCGGL